MEYIDSMKSGDDESDSYIQNSEKTYPLESDLKKLDIKIYNKSQFENLRIIGGENLAVVHEATFQGVKYALKPLSPNSQMNYKSFKKIKHELKLFYEINAPNIAKFYGILRDPQVGIILVLQYANNGSLRKFLQNKLHENAYKILWSEVIRIAKGIVTGLTFLHAKEIIHGDLNSKNILINNGEALIADFGLSKYPQDDEKSAIYDKKSDINHLGMLLWELTSGIPLDDKSIKMKLITNTPSDYADIYNKCCAFDQNQRPTLDKIDSDLNLLSTNVTIEFITNNITQNTLSDNNINSSKNSNMDNHLRDYKRALFIITKNQITDNQDIPITIRNNNSSSRSVVTPTAIGNIKNNNNSSRSIVTSAISGTDLIDKKLQTDNAFVELLEKTLSQNNIDLYDCNKFSDFTEINNNPDSQTMKVYWKSRDLTVILKSLTIKDKNDSGKFLKEVCNLH
ncbi:14646_t:CDS:2 [Dentiscutata erythropus]|uniref:14646_t:CDS:1 n=1 Tax=Dentiscutata erythropus TaxID=1348616 RepID=A0A9N9FJC1_9GLOM|nr:14646_t:CDS:2 [Dentiscutata erythropus]